MPLGPDMSSAATTILRCPNRCRLVQDDRGCNVESNQRVSPTSPSQGSPASRLVGSTGVPAACSPTRPLGPPSFRSSSGQRLTPQPAPPSLLPSVPVNGSFRSSVFQSQWLLWAPVDRRCESVLIVSCQYCNLRSYYNHEPPLLVLGRAAGSRVVVGWGGVGWGGMYSLVESSLDCLLQICMMIMMMTTTTMMTMTTTIMIVNIIIISLLKTTLLILGHISPNRVKSIQSKCRQAGYLTSSAREPQQR